MEAHSATVDAMPEAGEAARANQEPDDEWPGARLPRTRVAAMGAIKQRAKRRGVPTATAMAHLMEAQAVLGSSAPSRHLGAAT